MKNKTFKQATALLIAFVMIFSMCITGTGVSAATSDSSNKTVYLLPESSWRSENMRYAAYFWNGSIHTWVNATDEDGDGYYEVNVPSGFSNIIFVMFNSQATENDWQYMKSQTYDLEVPQYEYNCYMINDGYYQKVRGNWITYTPKSDDTTAVPTEADTEAPTEATTKVTEPQEETTVPVSEKKLNAFRNTLWVDTSSDSAAADSEMSLVKISKQGSSYSFYLPETADLNALPVYFNGYSSVKIGDYTIKSGEKYTFSNSQTYTLTLNGSNAGSVKFYQSTSPALYLNTNTDLPTGTYTGYENKDSFTTSGKLATSEDGQSYQETDLKKIKGRGNSSWEASYKFYGKYSFNITLSKKTKLFSTMNKGKKFCLLANNVDESYLRNSYTFALAKEIGIDFTPTFQYVDLYNNGEYMGSYLVTDKVDVNSQLVDLSCNLDDVNSAANNNADLSGNYRRSNGYLSETSTRGFKKWVEMNEPTSYEDGTPLDVSAGDGAYLLEFELDERFPDEVSGFISDKGQQVVVKTPEFASKAEVDYISNLFNNAESVLYNSSSTLEDLEKVIDVESFTKVYLIQELSENLDSCSTSYYIYYDSKVDKRLHAAPVWDYDWAYGQYSNSRQIAPGKYLSPSNPEQWFARIKNIYVHNDKVYGTLNFQAQFANSVAWDTVIKYAWNGKDGFYNKAKNLVNNTLQSYIEDVEASAVMNESRWNFIKSDPLISWGSADTGSSFYSTTSYLKDWINARLDWMNKELEASLPTDQYIYFDDSYYHWGNVYVYIYSDSGEYVPWKGTAMQYDSSTGYYKFAVPSGFENGYVIFNNGTGTQIPSSMQPGFKLDGKSVLFKNGDLIEYDVQPTTTQPTTAQPTTVQPTTAQPTTAQPTTVQPTTEQDTTEQPTTSVIPNEYYLAGYINGRNYGVEEDAQNLGDYKFVDGKVTLRLTEASYVLVKSNNNTLYQTQGLVTDTNSVTLYNSDAIGSMADKLMVPEGLVTFTLSENADDTLNLSYTIESEETTTESSETVVYFKPNDNWKQYNPRFAAYLWNGGKNIWVDAEEFQSGVYKFVIPKDYPNIIFTRMSPATTENSWGNKWNQTIDISVEAGRIYVLDEGMWEKGSGIWLELEDIVTMPVTEPTTEVTEPTETTIESTTEVPTTAEVSTTVTTTEVTEPTEEPTTQPTTIAETTTLPATQPTMIIEPTTVPITQPTTSSSTEPTSSVSGVSIVGNINLKLNKNDDGIYSAVTELESGSYTFKISNDGVLYCNGSTFNDKTVNVAYNSRWKSATTLKASGGKYTFLYNSSTNRLTIKYCPKLTTSIFGDINLELKETKDSSVYSASIELEKGTHSFRVMNQNVQYCCGSTFKDSTAGCLYKNNWKSVSTLIASGGTYTFIYDTSLNKLTISYMPDGPSVGIVGDFTLSLNPTDYADIYTVTKKIDAGSYDIKVNNFGKTCGCSATVKDSTKALGLNPKWMKYTTFIATGGTYTFTYNVSKNILSIKYAVDN